MKTIDDILKKIILYKNKKKIVFLIGNTTKAENNDFYCTPIRHYDQIIVAGVVVYSEKIAKEIAKKYCPMPSAPKDRAKIVK